MKKRLFAIITTVAFVVAMIPSMVFGAEVSTVADLQTAINAGGEVSLGTNINAGDTKITIPAGKNVVLDLKGYTLSGVCNDGTYDELIHVENNATLTIKDSVGNGKITYASGALKTGGTVWVEGDLILNSGTIELTGSWSLGFAVDVRPNAWGTAYDKPTSFVMNGGQIISSDTAVRVAANSDGSHPNKGVSFTMNGGTIDCDWDAIFVQHLFEEELEVTVNDGNVAGENSVLRIYGDAGSEIDMDIQGGSFEGDVRVSGAYSDTDSLAVTGGEFDEDVSNYVTDDSLMVKVSDESGNIGYFVGDDAKEAAENAPKGATVSVMKALKDTGIEVPAGTKVENNSGVEIKVNDEALANGAEVEAAEKQAPNTGGEDEKIPAPEDAVDTGDNMNVAIPFVIAGLALVAIGVVVATRRRTN